MKRIVEATYPSLDFGDELRDIEVECASPNVRIAPWSQSIALTSRSPMAKS